MENKKQYKHETFEDSDFDKEKEFAKYDVITFIGCTFIGEIDFKPKISLRFSHCTFKNTWKHILCEKIVYSKCIFNEFEYINISRDKEISKDSTIFDCTFNSIDCEGIIFQNKFIQIVDEKKVKHINNIRLVNCEFGDEFVINYNAPKI